MSGSTQVTLFEVDPAVALGHRDVGVVPVEAQHRQIAATTGAGPAENGSSRSSMFGRGFRHGPPAGTPVAPASPPGPRPTGPGGLVEDRGQAHRFGSGSAHLCGASADRPGPRSRRPCACAAPRGTPPPRRPGFERGPGNQEPHRSEPRTHSLPGRSADAPANRARPRPIRRTRPRCALPRPAPQLGPPRPCLAADQLDEISDVPGARQPRGPSPNLLIFDGLHSNALAASAPVHTGQLTELPQARHRVGDAPQRDFPNHCALRQRAGASDLGQYAATSRQSRVGRAEGEE